MSKSFHWGQTSQSKLIGCTSDMISIANLALEISNVDFGISRGYSSAAAQLVLFNNGKTELNGTDGISAHQLGEAVDVVWSKTIGSDRLNCYDYSDMRVKAIWLEIGRSFLRASRLLNIDIEWGLTYDINGEYDVYHFQLKGE